MSKDRNNEREHDEEKNDDKQYRNEDGTLTTRQGHPVRDNQNSKTVGNRGPTTLENYEFLEK